MRIAICDDDRLVRTALFDKLSGWYGQDHHIALFCSGSDLLGHYHAGAPYFDILLLDIIMPDINGIETALKIRTFDRWSTIIFITTTRDYSLDGYSVNAYDYILKPFDDAALRNTFESALTLSSRREKRIFVQYRDETIMVNVLDISYIEKRGRHICIKLISDREVLSSDSLKDIYAELPCGQFAMTDQAYIVNLQHVVIIQQKERFALMRNGHRIPISRPRLKSVLVALMNYGKGWGT